MENKIIPLSDFVQTQLDTKQSTSEFKETVRNYTEFLKQPLALWMFVPVDENNVPLEEPHNYGLIELHPTGHPLMDKSLELTLKYKEAKERVLFENAVRIDRSPYKCTGRLLIDLAIDTPFRILTELRYPDGKIERTEFPSPKKPNMTIEDLVSYNLTLTATAIKNIYES